jgi:hypothetical protein
MIWYNGGRLILAKSNFTNQQTNRQMKKKYPFFPNFNPNKKKTHFLESINTTKTKLNHPKTKSNQEKKKSPSSS